MYQYTSFLFIVEKYSIVWYTFYLGIHYLDIYIILQYDFIYVDSIKKDV